jgi:hypothetical protein
LLSYLLEGHLGDKFELEAQWEMILRSWLASQPKMWSPDHQPSLFHSSLFAPFSFLFPIVPRNLKERFGLNLRPVSAPCRLLATSPSFLYIIASGWPPLLTLTLLSTSSWFSSSSFEIFINPSTSSCFGV